MSLAGGAPMNIILINPPALFFSRSEAAYSHCLGLRSLSSCLKARGGHRVTFLDALLLGFSRVRRYAGGWLAGLDIPDLVARIPEDAGLIGVSVPFSRLARVGHDLVAEAKSRFPRALVVMGGVYPSAQPRLALSSRADCVVVGEGELALPRLAEGGGGPIPGVYRAADASREAFPAAESAADLDGLPFPDDDIPRVEEYFRLSPRGVRGRRTAAVVTSRGCPYDCEFCSVHPVCGHRWRARSPGHVLEEIARLNRAHGVRRIEVEDDNFAHDPARAAAILEGIVRLNERGAGLEWTAPNGLRVETIDGRLARLMRRSGCAGAAVGLEHGDPEMLRLMGKRQDPERALAALRLLAAAGVPGLSFFYMVGYPGETRERFASGLAFLRRVRALGAGIAASVNIAQPYPGTRLLERCRREGLITEPEADNFLVRRAVTSSEHSVEIQTPDFDAPEVLRRRQAVYDLFAPPWKRALRRLLLGALLAAAAPARAAPSPEPEPPHILFIVLDAARADRLSCCGYPKPTTPRLDELARRGAVFPNCFAPGPRTDRSVTRILSSRHLSIPIVPGDAFVYGVRRETPKTLRQIRDAGQIFLPELLGQNGYRTAVFTDHPWISENARLSWMFHERFFRVKWREDDEVLANRVSQWLSRARGKPAFAYIHLLCPHNPYLAASGAEDFLPGWTRDELARLRRKAELLRSMYSTGWSARELEGLAGLYDANLRRADRQVGAILDRVRQDGGERRTLVVVTADHAENLGEHGQLQHGGPTWDTVTRVPLILALPGAVPAGLVVQDDVSSLDIVPTLAALAGAKVPPGKSFDGESLLPVLRGARPARPFVLAEEYLREGGFKYISAPGHLADVRRDPGETRDLSASEPALLARMRARHAELMEPHRRRAAGAVRAGAPAYPFYYPMQAFSISPAPAVVREGPGNPRPEAPADASWVLRYDWEDPVLYRAAGAGPAVLGLSAPLPDGDYRASALIECSGSRIAAAKAFEFRLSSSAAFRRCPVSELSQRKVPRFYGAGKSFVSCPLGPAAVSGGVFQFEARAELPAADGCALRHVLFQPPGGLPGQNGASDPARTRELLRRMRQAGYW